jgi:hypothetical protein
MAPTTRNHVVAPLGLAIPKLPATSVILPMATRIEEERELRREARETSEMIATSSAWFVAGKGQG